MNKILIVAAVAFCTAGTTGSAEANIIKRACMKSDRQYANPSLCGCIQLVADITLSRRDQKTAAKFFRDPHRAQEVRQSGRANDAQFWTKYRAFGQSAESYCS